MDLLDKLALAARRYEQQAAPRTGSKRFTLGDLLQGFNRQAILELTPVLNGKPLTTVRPDVARKLKVSLLDDGISAIHSDAGDWYEVFRTAPSGDLSKVHILAHSPKDEVVGELRLLIGQRRIEHYFEDDPIFSRLESAN